MFPRTTASVASKMDDDPNSVELQVVYKPEEGVDVALE